MKIAIVNTKGGASKSTTAFQLFGAYFLSKGIENFEVVEFDDENKDSKNFIESKIKTKRLKVGGEVTQALKDRILNEVLRTQDHRIFDVGGNKTTTIWLEALKSVRGHKKIDIWVLTASGGHQDIENMQKTLDIIKEFVTEPNVLCVLSRARKEDEWKFQYRKFFANKELSKYPFILLRDDNAIDLSRDLKKSVYEVVLDTETRQQYENQLDEIYNDPSKVNEVEQLLSICNAFDNSEVFYKKVLTKAFEQLDKILNLQGINND